MDINLTIPELSILEGAMVYAIEQYADSNGDIDPCCLIDVRDADRIGQYVDGKRIMNDVLDKILVALDIYRMNPTKTEDEDQDEESEQQYVMEINNTTTQETMRLTCEKSMALDVESILDHAMMGNHGFDYHTYCKVNTVPTLNEFLDKCTTHGGNWTAMFLSGIKAIDPWLFERMPEITYTFDEVCWIANHLIDERQELSRKYDVSVEHQRVWEWDYDTPAWRPMTEEELNMPFMELFCKLNNMSEAEYEAEIE